MATVIVRFKDGKLLPPKGFKLSKLGEAHVFSVTSHLASKERSFRLDPATYRFLEKIPDGPAEDNPKR
jgi:hypothetical protein